MNIIYLFYIPNDLHISICSFKKWFLSNPETVVRSTHGAYLTSLNVTNPVLSKLYLSLWSTGTLNLNCGSAV